MTLWTFLTGRCDSLAPSGTALVPHVGDNATRGTPRRVVPLETFAIAGAEPRRPATCEGSVVRDQLGVSIHHAIAATFDRHRGSATVAVPITPPYGVSHYDRRTEA